MKRVVITGATSFIGTSLIQNMSQKDYEIYAVIRHDSAKRLQKADHVFPITLEMADYKNLDKHIDQCDTFISLAWNGVRGDSRNNLPLQEDNYHFSMAALHAAIRLGCKTFISAGSQAEYGHGHTVISESTICRPTTAYGEQKLRFFHDASELCIQYHIDFKEPRFFSLYGINDFEGSMIVSMIRNMLQNTDCLLSDCLQKWDFLHIQDATNALLQLIEMPCANGVYNVASGITRPLKEFVEEIHQITASRSKLLFGAIPHPPSGRLDIKADISKLQRETGFSPQVSFQTGIHEVVDWVKKLSESKNKRSELP